MKTSSIVRIVLLFLVFFAGCSNDLPEKESAADQGNPTCPDPYFPGRSKVRIL